MVSDRSVVARMWRDDRGIALVTVLLVGAILTVLTSMASFVAIQELRAGADDRRSVAAVGYADAGIDRMLDYLSSGQVDLSKVYAAGCESPPLELPRSVVGNERGTFLPVLQVINNDGTTPETRFGQAACDARPTTVQLDSPLFVAVSSVGQHPTAKREVLQVFKVTPIGLPVGHYANFVSVTGNPTMEGVSIFSETQIYGRDKLAMKGTDPYYTLEDFWPGGPWGGRAGTDHIPAAVHAAGGLFTGSGGNVKPQFPGPVSPFTHNCTANSSTGGSGALASQSLWDSDGSGGAGPITVGCVGQTGYPPNSVFTSEDLTRLAPGKLGPQEHQAMKDAAKQFGLYCRFATSGNTCQKLGGPNFTPPSVWQSADIASFFAAGVHTFIAYFEFTSGSELANSIKWAASNSWPCSTTPSLNRNVTVIVKNGGFEMQSGSRLNGAVVVDGSYRYSGTPQVNGTIMAGRIEMSGNAAFTMDKCWLDTISGAFTSFQPLHWSELDR